MRRRLQRNSIELQSRNQSCMAWAIPDIFQSHGKKALYGLDAPLPELSSESALTHRTLLAVGKGGCRRLSMRLSKPYWDIMRSCHQYSVCSCRLHPSHYHANVANKASIASYLIRFWKAKVKVTCECCQAMTQGTLGTFDDIPYHVSTWGLQDGASQWFRMFCSTPPDVCWLFAVLSRNILLRLHAKGLGSLTDGKLLQCMENCATSMIDVGLQFGKESEINRINTEKCNWKDQKKQQQEHTGAIESRFTVWPPFPCSLQKHSF